MIMQDNFEIMQDNLEIMQDNFADASRDLGAWCVSPPVEDNDTMM